MEPVGPDSPCHHSDAPIRIRLLYVVVYDPTSALADAPQYLQNDGDHHEELPYPTPLELADKRIRFNYDSPKCQ